MPPLRMSRHAFTAGVRDADSALNLTYRERYGFRNFSDNRMHVVLEGDTLWHLAARYFAPIPRAAGLWWIIADYQPQPIHDATLALTVGRVLIIPSLRTVQERIFDARRRVEATP